jgi:hypothetical protein
MGETGGKPPPTRRQAITRRAVLKGVAAPAVALVGATWACEQPLTRHLLRMLFSSTAPPHSGLPTGYFHGCFNLEQPAFAGPAAALGINYTITYEGASLAAADPENALGKALGRFGIRTFLDLYSPALSCRNGTGQVDAARVRELVGRFHTSPLLAGYWTKDDDCGSEGGAVRELATLIRAIDANPRHLIMAGYGSAASVARNYEHGQADVLGFYPYPAAGPGPAVEVPAMLRLVRQRTPPGARPPPFIGIYQVFGAPPRIAVPTAAEVVRQVAIYRALGAVGVAGFGWVADGPLHTPDNDATLRHAIAAVTDWMLHGAGRLYTTGIVAGE